MLSPRKVGLQGKALTTWQDRNPSLGYGRGGLVLDTPLCVCDLIRARAADSDALDQSVTNPLLMTYSSAATSPWVCGPVRSSHQQRELSTVRAGDDSDSRPQSVDLCSGGKRPRRERKKKESRKNETMTRWRRKVSHSVSVPGNHVGIGFLSESALLDGI